MAGLSETYTMDTDNDLLPFVFEKVRGFPTDDGVNLYLYEDGTSLVNDEFNSSASGFQTGAQPGTAIAALSGGGGVRLSGSKWHEFTPFDVTGPWTVMRAGSIRVPLGALGAIYSTPIHMFKEYFTSPLRGLLWGMRTEIVPAAGGGIESEMRPAINGLTSPSVPPNTFTTAVDAWAFETLCVMMIRHNGTGSFTHEVYIPSRGVIPVLSVVQTYDETAMIAGLSGVADPTLTLFMGGLDSTAYGKGVVDLDASGAWLREFTTPYVRATLAAVAALGAERGRTGY